MVCIPCLREEWQWVSLSLSAPSEIPGDLPDIFSLTKYWGSVWWTIYFPTTRGIKIDSMKDLESTDSFTLGDSNKHSMKGSDLGEIWRLEALQGATGQDSHLQEVDEAPDSWEQHLSPCTLSSENLEGLTAKGGTLGLWAARKIHCGATKKWARMAKVAGSLDGDSVVGQSRPTRGQPKAGPAGAQNIWDPGHREHAGEIWTWSKTITGSK